MPFDRCHMFWEGYFICGQMDQRKNYRQYLKCPEKDIPKRSCRRYRNEDPSTECDLSFGTNLGTTEVDSESSVEGDLKISLGLAQTW